MLYRQSSQNVEIEYQKAINAPVGDIEVLLAIIDPNSMIGRDFKALEYKKAVANEEYIKFLSELFRIQWLKRTAHKEEILAELLLKEMKEKGELLREWTTIQGKIALALKQEGLPQNILTLMKEMKTLEDKAAQYAEKIINLMQTQVHLNQQWNVEHRKSANQFISDLNRYLVTTGQYLMDPNGNPINLTDAKKKQLADAFMSPSPIIITEAIADRIEDPKNKKEQQELTDGINNFNNVMGILNFGRRLNGDENQELLEGDAAIKALRQGDKLFADMGKKQVEDEIKQKLDADLQLGKERATELAETFVKIIRERLTDKKDFKLAQIANKTKAKGLANKFAEGFLEESTHEVAKKYKLEDIVEMVMKVGTNKPALPKRNSDTLATILENTLQAKHKKDEYTEGLRTITDQMKEKTAVLEKELDKLNKRPLPRPTPSGTRKKKDE